MPVRIRFDVTSRESSDSVCARVAIEQLAASGGAENVRGEREVMDGDAAEVAAICARVNEAFASVSNAGARVRFEIDAPSAGEAKTAAGAREASEAATVRDLNGSGARAALLKLLAAPAMAASRAKHAEAQWARGEENGILVARARGSAWAAAESLRGLACVGATPEAVAVKIALPNPCGVAALASAAETVMGAAAATREMSVRIEGVAFVEGGAGESEVIAVGLAKAGAGRVSSFARGPGERLVFLGEAPSGIVGSRFVEAVHGMTAGRAWNVEIAGEKGLHEVLRTLIAARVITAARGVGEGGLMATVCGMLLGGERRWGARLDLTPLGGARADALLFGEDGARAVVEVATERVGTVISEAHMHGVPAALIGEVIAEELLELKTRSLATAWPLEELRKAWDAGS